MRTILFISILTAATPQFFVAQHAQSSLVPNWGRFAADMTTTPINFEPKVRVPALRGPFASDTTLLGATFIRTVDTATLIGAGVGFVAGAGATWAILQSGGSTALCNRDANQDAMSAGECLGITVIGGAAGALLGAVVARWLHPDR